MTSDLAYPDFGGGFRDVIEQYRCRASSSTGLRCQLFEGHVVDDGERHGASWLEGQQPGGGHRVPLRRARFIRWDDDGAEQEFAPGSQRLRWCAFQAAG